MLQCTDPKRHQISRGTLRFWIASSVPCMCIYNTLSFAKALAPLLVKKNDPYREDISARLGGLHERLQVKPSQTFVL